MNLGNINKELIVGAWSLIRWTTIYDNGKIIFPMGKDAQGMLIYTNDNHMSASLYKIDRVHFVSGEMLTANMEEKIQAWDSYFSYSGTFKLVGNNIYHNVISSMYPNWVGDDQQRVVSIKNSNLVLETIPQESRRGKQYSKVEWKKMTNRI